MAEMVHAVLGFVAGWIAGSWFLGNLLLSWAFSFPLTLKAMQCRIFRNKLPLILEYFWMAVWMVCLLGATVVSERYLPNSLYAYPLGLGMAFLFAMNRSGPSDKNLAMYLRVYGRHMDLLKFERLRPVLLKQPPSSSEGSTSQENGGRAGKGEAL